MLIKLRFMIAFVVEICVLFSQLLPPLAKCFPHCELLNFKKSSCSTCRTWCDWPYAYTVVLSQHLLSLKRLLKLS